MSKIIPAQLLDAYSKPGKSTAFCVKVVDSDGVAYGFTTLDSRVPFNDGIHNVVYIPDQELRPQNIQNTLTMDVDNTELVGYFSQTMEQLMLAGKMRGAEITIYRVAYLKLSYGAEVIGYGRLGKVEYAANAQGKRKIEFRSLSQLLKDHVNDMWSLTCRADFGDDKCKMPFVWQAAEIIDVEDNFNRFRLDVTQPNDYFTLGIIQFLDGQNNQAERELESWLSTGWLTLSFVTPYPVNVGDILRIRQDCDKTATACKAYNNMPNMRAEHLTPVQDQSLMVPGAYIKSQNAL